MRHLVSAASAVLVGALLLASPALRADDKRQDHHKRWDKYEMLKKRLDLSGDQVSQWRDAEKTKQEQAKLLRDKVKADEAQLAVLVDQKASDDDLKAALDTLDSDHKALAENGQKFLDRLREILNPLQQAKAVLMMGGRKHGRRGWGGPEGCGPRGNWGGSWKGQGHGDMGPGRWDHPKGDGAGDMGGQPPDANQGD